MLPALDRCAVILSRFAGIAKFQGENDTVGFSSLQISLITDTISCLHLVSSKIIMQVVDEIDLFTSFSSWVRYEIDRLASENSLNEEATDKESSIDHSKVLLYLQTYMTASPLGVYFVNSSDEDYKACWSQVGQGVPIFDLLVKQLRKQEKGHTYITPLPRLDLLCKFLANQASTIFGQIAEAEKRNVLFGKALEVGVAAEESPMDMKMNEMVGINPHTHWRFANA